MPGMESFFRVFFVEFRTWRSHVRSGVAPSGSWRRRASVGADLQGKRDKKVGFLGACYLAYMSLFALVLVVRIIDILYSHGTVLFGDTKNNTQQISEGAEGERVFLKRAREGGLML